MKTIYEPAGRAREYSPLALNVFNGCDHDCCYCFVKSMPFAHQSTRPEPRPGLLAQLEKDAPKFSNGPQVLLSFMSDPYCRADEKPAFLRQVLEILCRYDVNVAILTKGGPRSLRDLDLFLRFKRIKIGATLTYTSVVKSLDDEPGAATPAERFNALQTLHEAGVRTFASLEPVLDPAESLDIIRQTHHYVDIYKVGKLNHAESLTDWRAFGAAAVELLTGYGKLFYVKNDLAALMDPALLRPENRNPDLFD